MPIRFLRFLEHMELTELPKHLIVLGGGYGGPGVLQMFAGSVRAYVVTAIAADSARRPRRSAEVRKSSRKMESRF